MKLRSRFRVLLCIVWWSMGICLARKNLCTTSPVAIETPESYPWKYVLIIGQGRSGSTLVQRLVNMVPGFFINGENDNAISDLLRIRYRYQNTMSDEALPDNAESTAETRITRMDRAFGPLIDSFLMPRQCLAHTIGFKEIRIWLNKPYAESAVLIEQFMQFEPRTAIIFVTRPSSELIHSGWWKDQNPAHAKNTLDTQSKNFYKFHQDHLNATYWLTYRDTVDETEEFRGLFTFLGVNYPAESYRIATKANPS